MPRLYELLRVSVDHMVMYVVINVKIVKFFSTLTLVDHKMKLKKGAENLEKTLKTLLRGPHRL